MDGWIKLHRRITEHPFWKEKRTFSRLEAWEDILLSANFKDCREIVKGKLVEYKRGEYSTSELKLCSKWRWSRNRVRAYLRLLEVEEMITRKGTADGTTLTVVKYDVYQGDDTTDGTTEGTAEGTTESTPDGTPEGTQNKKEKKERKKENIYVAEFEQFWLAYPEGGYQGSKPQALKNFVTLIKKGVSADRLIQAAKNFATDCTALGKTDYIYKASNFLGNAEYYKAYLPETWIPAKPKPQTTQQPWQPRQPVYKFNSDCKYCEGKGKYTAENGVRVSRCTCGVKIE